MRENNLQQIIISAKEMLGKSITVKQTIEMNLQELQKAEKNQQGLSNSKLLEELQNVINLFKTNLKKTRFVIDGKQLTALGENNGKRSVWKETGIIDYKLPTECWHNISKYINLQDLAHLSATCKELWNKLLSLRIENDFQLNIDKNTLFTQFSNDSAYEFGNVAELIFEAFYIDGQERLKEELIAIHSKPDPVLVGNVAVAVMAILLIIIPVGILAFMKSNLFSNMDEKTVVPLTIALFIVGALLVLSAKGAGLFIDKIRIENKTRPVANFFADIANKSNNQKTTSKVELLNTHGMHKNKPKFDPEKEYASNQQLIKKTI